LSRNDNKTRVTKKLLALLSLRDNHLPAATANRHPDCRAPPIQIVALYTTTVSDAATKFIKNEQGKVAREGAAAKNARLQKAVQEEVEAVKPQRAMAVSEDYARFIRPGVLKRLGITENNELTEWPKNGAIKNCLRKIKKGNP